MRAAPHIVSLRAWGALLALTVLGTVLSQDAVSWLRPQYAGLAILAVAIAKARIILLDYLGLRGAPSWRRGGVTCLVFAGLLLAGLYMVG
ncbi:cytochrome C oxidase subunit IV family protein [Dinoroseobacter sp. PD6]|uniref:cytochrome C oxidase subunit IV family protein n=1 Tax=Dinoroseobacter sp. PD6 TaxID=3028384 RepID=UPI00237A9AFA|nr:cytochrome C oxidase subunit IV family protein [Dinoroseobacter sp. PD6]MDD9717943.1 cytochrome C oxidase subunit IV family protein [Dinoroseobacter sp. PD6]